MGTGVVSRRDHGLTDRQVRGRTGGGRGSRSSKRTKVGHRDGLYGVGIGRSKPKGTGTGIEEERKTGLDRLLSKAVLPRA